MPIVTDEVLNRGIKEGLQPLYFLYGSETRLLQNTVKAIEKAGVDPSFATFNLQKFDESVAVDQLQTAYEALPMMAPLKLVLVRDFDFSKQGKSGQDTVMAMLTPPNPSTVLVFYYTDTEYDPKKKAGSKKLCDLVAKHGQVCNFALKDRATLKRALQSRCKKAGVTLPNQTADYLIDRCGMQYGLLLSEVEKLIAYADGGEITTDAVTALCMQNFQNKAFDLCNALLKNQYDSAYQILDHLLYQKIDPMELIGALATSFSDLYRAKSAQVAGLPLSQVVTDFKYGGGSFRITKLQSSLSRISLDKIRACLHALERANLLMISSKVEHRLVLEQAFGQMLAYRR